MPWFSNTPADNLPGLTLNIDNQKQEIKK